MSCEKSVSTEYNASTAYVQELYQKFTFTLPWPEFYHPPLCENIRMKPSKIDGKSYVLFDATDKSNYFSNRFEAPTPMKRIVYPTAEHFKLALIAGKRFILIKIEKIALRNAWW